MSKRKYANYTIKQGDSLESIAATVLGKAGRWPELVQANSLRYPYLSDDPLDQLGAPLFTTTLTTTLSGTFFFKTASYNTTAFQAGNVVLIKGSNNSLPFYDILPIAGSGTLQGAKQVWSDELTAILSPAALTNLGTGNLVYLNAVTPNVYSTGTTVRFYPPASAQRTFVLGTGATLRIPLDEDTSNVLTISGDEYASLLGVDLALDTQGCLSLTDRDMSSVKGADNLSQALRIRCLTEQGELVYHPQYGDPLLKLIGTAQGNVVGLAYGQLARTLLADPRVGRIEGMVVSQQGDALIVSAQVQLRDRSTLLALEDLVLQGL